MDAVIFDLYDTLVRAEKSTAPSRAREFSLGLRRHPAVGQWWEENRDRRQIGDFPSYLEVLRHFCRLGGQNVDDSLLQTLATERLEEKAATLRLVEPLVLNAIRSLKDVGLPVGVLSNAVPDEAAGWGQCPLREVVDVALFSCEIGAMKPDPDAFHTACDHLGADPVKTWFVGDGGFDELPGAARAGLRPVQACWYRRRGLEWGETQELLTASTMAEAIDMIQTA